MLRDLRSGSGWQHPWVTSMLMTCLANVYIVIKLSIYWINSMSWTSATKSLYVAWDKLSGRDQQKWSRLRNQKGSGIENHEHSVA